MRTFTRRVVEVDSSTTRRRFVYDAHAWEASCQPQIYSSMCNAWGESEYSSSVLDTSSEQTTPSIPTPHSPNNIIINKERRPCECPSANIDQRRFRSNFTATTTSTTNCARGKSSKFHQQQSKKEKTPIKIAVKSAAAAAVLLLSHSRSRSPHM